jgi:hypothetical protein
MSVIKKILHWFKTPTSSYSNAKAQPILTKLRQVGMQCNLNHQMLTETMAQVVERHEASAMICDDVANDIRLMAGDVDFYNPSAANSLRDIARELRSLKTIKERTSNDENDKISDFDFANGGIDGYTGKEKELVIPRKIGDEEVTNIGQSAFRGLELKSVIIPDTVQVIYDDAFSMNNLTSIIIPDSVSRIYDHAFEDNQLTQITLSKNITKLGAGVFVKNRLTKVSIPIQVMAQSTEMQFQLMQAFDAGVSLEGR